MLVWRSLKRSYKMAHKVYSSIVTASWQKETYKMDVTKTGKGKIVLADTHISKEIDVSWLPAASEAYQISADIKDYIAVSIPIVSVDIPNRNLQCFPYEEVSRFDVDQGKLIYQTFYAKPCHIDHQNSDPTQAKGVHADVNMQYIPKWGIWKINVLCLWDRTKDTDLVKQILGGARPYYSMGAWVNSFICSVCGDSEDTCAHMQNKGGIFDGGLSYQNCLGVQFFETSNVSSPADPTAESNAILV